MERFVCDLDWQFRLSWIVSIATAIAILVFGAPLTTFFFMIVGELIFFTVGESWYRRRRIRR